MLYRYYAIADVFGGSVAASAEEPFTVCYARVCPATTRKLILTASTRLQKPTALRKDGVLRQVIRDLGSGMNYRRKGLQELLELVLHQRVSDS